MESRTKYQFSVNTSNVCFLCLEEINYVENLETLHLESSQENDNGNNKVINKNVSLRYIFRYLKIDLTKIKSLSKKSASLLNRTDVRVSLCRKCTNAIERFSEQYAAMELNRMRLESTLEIIHKLLHHSNECPSLVEKYRRKIEKEEGQDKQAQKHSKIVKEFREEIVYKTQKIITNLRPKLILNRVQIPTIFFRTNGNKKKDPVIKSEAFCDDDDENFDDDCFPPSSADIFEEPAQVAVEHPVKQLQNDNLFPLLEGEPEEHNIEASPFASSLEIKVRHDPMPSGPEKKEISVSKMYTKNSKTGTYDCSGCKKTFKASGHIREHYELVHLRLRKHKCDICGGGYSSGQMLRIHRGKCNGTKKRSRAPRGSLPARNPKTGKFHCDKCQKEYSFYKGLFVHVNAVHRTKQSKCNICSKTFKYQSQLSKHKKICQHQNKIESKISDTGL